MIKKDNPAGRLHDLLARARKGKPNIAINDVWAHVFEIEKGNTISLYYNLGMLHNQMIEVEQMIAKIPNINHDLLLRNSQNIKKAFSWPNIHSHWGELRNVLTEESVTDLAYCAEEIDRFYNEQPIPIETLNEIDSDISNLFREISEASIEIKLKTTLLDLLEAMRRAIAEYNIRGAKGLREVVDYSIGSILRHKDDIKEESDQPWFKKFSKILTKVDVVESVK